MVCVTLQGLRVAYKGEGRVVSLAMSPTQQMFLDRIHATLKGRSRCGVPTELLDV